MARTKASLLLVATAVLTVVALFCMPYTPRPVVRTTVVERGELVRSLLLSGTVRYLQEQPCVALQDGRVAAVYAKAGQTVQAGELLFRLDTSAQEAALAECMKAYQQHSQLDKAVAALAVQGKMELRQMEAELRAAIEASCVRAEADGVVGAVYVAEGDWIQAGTLMGWTRSQQKCVQAEGAAQRLTDLPTGAAAVLETGGTAQLHALAAPGSDGMQQMTLLPTDAQALEGVKAGESLTVELLCETVPDIALVPLSAVSAQNEIWLVQDGTARPQKVDISQRNAVYVAVPVELAGMRVVLQPDEERLSVGCAVKEADGR